MDYEFAILRFAHLCSDPMLPTSRGLDLLHHVKVLPYVAQILHKPLVLQPLFAQVSNKAMIQQALRFREVHYANL
jgi:hypothetical protein